MKQILVSLRWFFTGLRLFLPLIPGFVWSASRSVTDSTVKYWKDSQSVVDGMADEFMSKAPQEVTTDYDPYGYYVCYSIAAFLYLVGWLVIAWLTFEAFRLLILAIF
jgi:hypothetical protein